MDWNLKATSWDFTEFVEETVKNTDEINGNGSSSYEGDFRFDLKLGQVGNSDKWNEPGVLKIEPFPTSKKARSMGAHPVSCLVDGCGSDLSNCRDYHRRHKVCELHSKTAQVMVNGLKKRFCQQCSRFHSLEEFDDGKRSCRTRLDRHNRRRRKPQSDTLSRPRSYFSGYQGSQMLPFSSMQVYPSTTVVKTTWSGVDGCAIESRCLNPKQPLSSPVKQNLVLGSSSSNYREGKQCMFLQAENQPSAAKASVCQPVLGAVAPFSEDNRACCHGMFCDRVTTQVQDSDCALSLLSSPLSHTSGGIGSSNMVQTQSFSLMQPSGPSPQNYIVEPMGGSAVASGRGNAVHGSGIFHMDYGGSSGSETPQTLPFHWQ